MNLRIKLLYQLGFNQRSRSTRENMEYGHYYKEQNFCNCGSWGRSPQNAAVSASDSYLRALPIGWPSDKEERLDR
jgi:hypothetical protein